MKQVLESMWIGLWQGIGVELSFFVLWVGWKIFHRRIAPKVDSDHVIHTIHEYFTK